MIRIKSELKKLQFKKTFTIAYESVDQVEVIIIKLEDNNGNVGLGSASPDQEVTGEEISDSYKLASELKDDFFIYDIDDWMKYHNLIQERFANSPALASALEEALLNLFCSKHNLNLSDIFGRNRESCEIFYTIGIQDELSSIQEVSEKSSEGFKYFKIKCGLDVEREAGLISKLRQNFSNLHFAADANHGFDFDQAKFFLKEVDKHNLLFVEEPLKTAENFYIEKLSRSSKTILMADESIIDNKDAEKIIKDGFYQAINIKLMKCGGPVNSLSIFELAKKNNLKTMIGCNYESNISISTGAALALALPIDYVDLDSGTVDFDETKELKGGAKVHGGSLTYTSICSPR